MMRCESCQEPTKRVIIHERKLVCPLCFEDAQFSMGDAHAVHRDKIPGGITLENYGPNPVTFYSHSERRAYMKAHGLAEMEKCCPFPGTDKDPMGIPNPNGYKDPQTLANAAALICRNGRKDFDGVTSGVLRNLDVKIVADANAMRDALGQKRQDDAPE